MAEVQRCVAPDFRLCAETSKKFACKTFIHQARHQGRGEREGIEQWGVVGGCGGLPFMEGGSIGFIADFGVVVESSAPVGYKINLSAGASLLLFPKGSYMGGT